MKLMTHLYFGDPSKEFSVKLAEVLLRSGADYLEIGIPYTDPVCDGEVFQRACRRALNVGTTPYDVLAGIKKINSLGFNKPIYLTTYFGPVFKIGVAKFCRLAKAAGVKGLIIPDILLEEQTQLLDKGRTNGLEIIQFATIYSDKKRLDKICSKSGSFIYCTALAGVTGDRVDSRKVIKFIKFIKSMTEKKILVGFGIKSPQNGREILQMGADGIIVGSAIAKIYERNLDYPEKSLSQIAEFIKSLKESTIQI